MKYSLTTFGLVQNEINFLKTNSICPRNDETDGHQKKRHAALEAEEHLASLKRARSDDSESFKRYAIFILRFLENV